MNICSSLLTDPSLASYSLLSVRQDRVVICGLAGQEVTGNMRGKIFAPACHEDLVLVYGSEGALVLLVVERRAVGVRYRILA